MERPLEHVRPQVLARGEDLAAGALLILGVGDGRSKSPSASSSTAVRNADHESGKRSITARYWT
ncbi:hypothetical protein ACIGFK_03400 [Streptomyces sp. NPDC085524]|uniref:hypothetical protein n=1 Tax=Streptomyces sp. NPDC085524 TaxID=3365728 RepID=UPI0037D1715F